MRMQQMGLLVLIVGSSATSAHCIAEMNPEMKWWLFGCRCTWNHQMCEATMRAIWIHMNLEACGPPGCALFSICTSRHERVEKLKLFWILKDVRTTQLLFLNWQNLNSEHKWHVSDINKRKLKKFSLHVAELKLMKSCLFGLLIVFHAQIPSFVSTSQICCWAAVNWFSDPLAHCGSDIPQRKSPNSKDLSWHQEHMTCEFLITMWFASLCLAGCWNEDSWPTWMICRNERSNVARPVEHFFVATVAPLSLQAPAMWQSMTHDGQINLRHDVMHQSGSSNHSCSAKLWCCKCKLKVFLLNKWPNSRGFRELVTLTNGDFCRNNSWACCSTQSKWFKFQLWSTKLNSSQSKLMHSSSRIELLIAQILSCVGEAALWKFANMHSWFSCCIILLQLICGEIDSFPQSFFHLNHFQ